MALGLGEDVPWF